MIEESLLEKCNLFPHFSSSSQFESINSLMKHYLKGFHSKGLDVAVFSNFVCRRPFDSNTPTSHYGDYGQREGLLKISKFNSSLLTS